MPSPPHHTRIWPTTIRLLNVTSPDMELLLDGPVRRCVERRPAASLGDLHAVLRRHEGTPAAPTTLDLIGHSTAGHHYLRLGHTPIDLLDRAVARFFQTLADDGIISRLQIAAVRLLGCETATTDAAQRTMRTLSATLRVPVLGTMAPLMGSHYDARGFNPAFSHLLFEASPLQ
jgi:hypothetical protein